MAEDFVSFDNRMVHLLNPLPKVTLAELHKLANVPLRKRRQAKNEVFPLELRWGGGEDLKTHTLLPGHSIRMPEKIGLEVHADFKPVGGFCSTSPGLAMFRLESERQDAMIEALEIAAQQYELVGSQQIEGVRSSRGHRDEDVERFRGSTYATYYLAEAKAKLIRDRIEEIQRGEGEKQQRKAG